MTPEQATDPSQPTGGDPSFDPDTDELPFELPSWQREILDERLADLERNPDDEQPWREVRGELLDG